MALNVKRQLSHRSHPKLTSAQQARGRPPTKRYPSTNWRAVAQKQQPKKKRSRRLILRPSSRAGCRSLLYLAPLGLISSNTGGDSSGDDSTGGDNRADSRSTGDDSTGGDSTGGDSRAGSRSSGDGSTGGGNNDDGSTRPKRVSGRRSGLMHRIVRLALSPMRLEAAALFPP